MKMNDNGISTIVVEKSLDIAKSFLDKLMLPAVEEVGLLLKDQISFWKFKNQVRILNRAKLICEKNDISPKPISIKLLDPFLQNAALEENEELQDKWAILLSNLVDSEQNIENHVFPFLLGQLSINEFKFIEDEKKSHENYLKSLKIKRKELEDEIDKLKEEQISLEASIKIEENKLKLNEGLSEHDRRLKEWNLSGPLRNLKKEIQKLQYEKSKIFNKQNEPFFINQSLEEFELSNLVRLGLVKSTTIPEISLSNSPIYIEDSQFLPNEIDIEVEMDYHEYEITELGDLFLSACSEKKEQNSLK